MTKHISITYSKNKKRKTIKYDALYNVKIVQEGNRGSISWESEDSNCSRNTLPQRLAGNNCQSILSEDGESILISCSELEDNELIIGVSKRSFTTSQNDLLAKCFIRQPNPPFKDVALKISRQYATLQNESATKIKKWFEYIYRAFKIGKYPGWAYDPDTKKIRYHSKIGQDGRMTIYRSYSVNDLKFRENSNNSTSYDVINKEADQHLNRKINPDSNQEYIAYSGEKSTADFTAIPITPIIKQEPVDYEAQQPQLPPNYKIPKLPHVASFPHSITRLIQIKKENSSLCTPNGNQPSKISPKYGNEHGSTNKRESSAKNQSFGGAVSQPVPTYKPKQNKRKRRNRRRRKLNNFKDYGVVSPTKMVELKTIMQKRPQRAPTERKRRLSHHTE